MKSSHISSILYNEWDPIEVRGSAPEDEYQSYAERIIKILEHGGEREEILRLLDHGRTREMMLKSDNQNDARVTELIEEYWRSLGNV